MWNADVSGKSGKLSNVMMTANIEELCWSLCSKRGVKNEISSRGDFELFSASNVMGRTGGIVCKQSR